MSKKIASIQLNTVLTDAEKLAQLVAAPATVPAEVIPTIPVETPTVVVPTPAPQPVQTVAGLDAAQVLAFLNSNPEVLRAAYGAVQSTSVSTVTLKPTVTKSAQKAGYVNMAFSAKPSAESITELKAAKYRWSPFNKVWYGPGEAFTNHPVYGADIQAALKA